MLDGRDGEGEHGTGGMSATVSVRAEGRVVSQGKRAAFAEGKLFDKDHNLCATATTTCLIFTKERRYE